MMVWQAEYLPWGAVQSLSGALTLDLRFPGQWFQLEAGLHYNWHRHYDASLGRYTQPDPLGFVDGPSVYGYARNNPYRYVDKEGRTTVVVPHPIILVPITIGILYCYIYPDTCQIPNCFKNDDAPIADNDNQPPPDYADYCKIRPGSGQSVAGGVQCIYDCLGGDMVVQIQPGPICLQFIRRPFWAD